MSENVQATVQAIPTGKVHGVWQYHRGARYPDFLEAEMSDGTTVVYQIKTIMPGPHFETADRVMTGYERRDDSC